MLILTRGEIASILKMKDTIDVVERGFALLAKGRVTMPQRTATPVTPYAGLHLTMPAFVAGEPAALSVKIVSVYPNNPDIHDLPTIQGVLLLHDAVTGKLLALMDAESITAMRTGAASGVATKHMARPDARIVCLFGAGVQAAAQLEAVCAVRDVKQAYVITRTGRKDAAFAAEMTSALDIPVTPSRDVRSAVEKADIICTATSSSMPIFDGAWLRPGTHINAIGAYKSTMRELDAVALQRSRVIVDHHTAAQAEAGDILLTMADAAITYDHVVAELGQVVIGDEAGRISPDDITLFKAVGLAMQDAVTAAHVYSLAIESGAGRSIAL